MKSAVLVSVLALTAFAVLEESAAARTYLNCVSKKVVIVDPPKGTTSSSNEENFGFWIDETTKVVTLADGKKLNVGRFDDGWITAVSGDVSYSVARRIGKSECFRMTAISAPAPPGESTRIATELILRNRKGLLRLRLRLLKRLRHRFSRPELERPSACRARNRTARRARRRPRPFALPTRGGTIRRGGSSARPENRVGW